jgi:hypothetical protein
MIKKENLKGKRKELLDLIITMMKIKEMTEMEKGAEVEDEVEEEIEAEEEVAEEEEVEEEIKIIMEETQMVKIIQITDGVQ